MIIIIISIITWPSLPNGSDGQVISGTDCSVNGSSSIHTRDTWLQVFSAMQGHWLLAFYDAITGPTEFIISLVNSVKIVNMP